MEQKKQKTEKKPQRKKGKVYQPPKEDYEKFPETLFKQNADDLLFLEDLANLSAKQLQNKYWPDSTRPDVAMSKKIAAVQLRMFNHRYAVNLLLTIEKRSPFVKKKMIYAKAPPDTDPDEELLSEKGV